MSIDLQASAMLIDMVNAATAQATFNAFVSTYPIVAYKKGDILAKGSERQEYIYVITSGKVRQLDASIGGNPVVVNIFAKPAFLSIFWLFGTSPNNYYYQAYTNVSVHKVPILDMHRFLLQNPDVMYVTIQRVVRGLDGFIYKLTAQMHGTAQQKIGTELLIEANRFHSDTENVKLDITVSELSARTGLARETVSRVVSQLYNDGVITKQKSKISIPSTARLKKSLNLG